MIPRGNSIQYEPRQDKFIYWNWSIVISIEYFYWSTPSKYRNHFKCAFGLFDPCLQIHTPSAVLLCVCVLEGDWLNSTTVHCKMSDKHVMQLFCLFLKSMLSISLSNVFFFCFYLYLVHSGDLSSSEWDWLGLNGTLLGKWLLTRVKLISYTVKCQY